mmetsp:Transcript_42835/g.104702  ORF Transcript_42835/g.104702 Transcript_42835/m.104702 type:complete len:220 (+) Transcript_42835:1051-1710(+)
MVDVDDQGALARLDVLQDDDPPQRLVLVLVLHVDVRHHLVEILVLPPCRVHNTHVIAPVQLLQRDFLEEDVILLEDGPRPEPFERDQALLQQHPHSVGFEPLLEPDHAHNQPGPALVARGRPDEHRAVGARPPDQPRGADPLIDMVVVERHGPRQRALERLPPVPLPRGVVPADPVGVGVRIHVGHPPRLLAQPPIQQALPGELRHALWAARPRKLEEH